MRRAAWTAVGGGGLLLAARAFDATALLVPGLGLILLGLLTPAWVIMTFRRIRLGVGPATTRAIEREPVELTVTVHRPRLGVPGAELVAPGGSTVAIRGGRVVLSTVALRRGRHRLELPQVRIRDPLGLVELSRPGPAAAPEVLILPRTFPLRRIPAAGPAGGGSSGPAGREPWGAGDVDGLRGYRPGTPASRIHWPALARGAGLLERRLVAEESRLPLVAVDPRADGDANRLDTAVRAAASLVLALAREGGCRLLLPGTRRPARIGSDLVIWPEAHARLALLADRGAPPSFSAGARGALIWVAAGPAGVRAATRLADDGASVVLVAPRELTAGLSVVPSFTVAGCGGLSLATGPSRRRDRAA